MSDSEKEARAEEAKRILDHPIFKEALDAAENAAWETFRKAEPTDTEGLVLCRLQLRAQENLRSQLIRIINAGKKME